MRLQHGAIVGRHLVWGRAVFGELHLCHHTETDVRAQPFGLLAKVIHQFLPRRAFWVAGEILHFGGLSQLSPGLHAFVEHRVQRTS